MIPGATAAGIARNPEGGGRKRMSHPCTCTRRFYYIYAAPDTENTGSYHGDIDAASLGDNITYAYTISNDGTTTISSLVLEDSAVSIILLT